MKTEDNTQEAASVDRPSPPVPLFVLACDHRASIPVMFGDMVSLADSESVERIKWVVFRGLLAAIEDDENRVDDSAGLLVDEIFGGAVARESRAHGISLTMPIEASGPPFRLQYPDDFVAHVATFEPDFAKAMMTINPEEGPAYRRQLDDLARAFAELESRLGRSQGMMLELIVPPTEEQLAQCGGDQERFDRELRPELVCRAIDDVYRLGMWPTVWKLEGLESVADYERVSGTFRRYDDAVRALVLGRRASSERVAYWLRLAARDDGFDGFAIGRSIWEEPIRGFLRGADSEATAIAAIGDRYAEFVEIYRQAAAG